MLATCRALVRLAILAAWFTQHPSMASATLAANATQLLAARAGKCPSSISQYRFAPGAKIMFCWIQKVGCTSFKSLIGGGSLRPSVIHKGESYSAAIKRIFEDSTWQKAMFYREPLSRFLSGYLDKCNGTVRVYCEMVFGSEETTFAEAVEFLRTAADPHKIDGHFRQQSSHCGGVGYQVNDVKKYYQTMELLEPATSREKVQGMMARSKSLKAYAGIIDRLFPPVTTGSAYQESAHHTHSHGKVAEYFFDPRHVATVVGFFALDYVTFQIPLPAFAREALLGLAAAKSPDALDTGLLRMLLSIPARGQAPQRILATRGSGEKSSVLLRAAHEEYIRFR